MSSVAAARSESGSYRAALIAAASVGDTVTVRSLVDGPSPPDMTPETRKAFLSVALLRAAQGGHLETIKALVRGGELESGDDASTPVDVSRPNADGNTPLHLACERGDTRCVDALLAANANLASRNCEGKTPIAVSRNSLVRAAIATEVERRKEAAKKEAERATVERNREGTSTSTRQVITLEGRARAVGSSRDTSSQMTTPLGKSALRKIENTATFPASPGSLQIKQKLKDDLKCVVCLRDFCSDGAGSSPVTLPCGHNFCSECVCGMRGTGDENQRRAFRCPLDRTMFSRHIDLKVNGAMRDLIGFMHSRVHGSVGSSSISSAMAAQPRGRSRLADGHGQCAPPCVGVNSSANSRGFSDINEKENEFGEGGGSPVTPVSGARRGSRSRVNISNWGDTPSPRLRRIR